MLDVRYYHFEAYKKELESLLKSNNENNLPNFSLKIVIASFACELGLKASIVYTHPELTINKKHRCKSKNPFKTHSLKKLFQTLNGKDQNEIINYMTRKIDKKEMIKCLKIVNLNFINWRYFSEFNELNSNLLFLNDLVNSLDKFLKKFEYIDWTENYGNL